MIFTISDNQDEEPVGDFLQLVSSGCVTGFVSLCWGNALMPKRVFSKARFAETFIIKNKVV